MPLPRLPTLEEHAAEWIWRLDPSAFTAADLQAFNAWLRQNPRQRRAAEEFFAVWLALNSFTSARRRTEPFHPEGGQNVS